MATSASSRRRASAHCEGTVNERSYLPARGLSVVKRPDQGSRVQVFEPIGDAASFKVFLANLDGYLITRGNGGLRSARIAIRNSWLDKVKRGCEAAAGFPLDGFRRLYRMAGAGVDARAWRTHGRKAAARIWQPGRGFQCVADGARGSAPARSGRAGAALATPIERRGERVGTGSGGRLSATEAIRN